MYTLPQGEFGSRVVSVSSQQDTPLVTNVFQASFEFDLEIGLKSHFG